MWLDTFDNVLDEHEPLIEFVETQWRAAAETANGKYVAECWCSIDRQRRSAGLRQMG